MKKYMLMIIAICLICGLFYNKASAIGDPCDGNPGVRCYYKPVGYPLWDVAGVMMDSESPDECNRRFVACQGNCFTCITEAFCTSSAFMGYIWNFCRNAKNEGPPGFTGK